jgi:hypothetical protein
MKNIFILMAAYALLLISPACKKEETTPPAPTPTPTTPTTPEGMVKIGETYILGAKTKAYVYAYQNLFVGYNKLFVAMYDSANGTRILNGHFDAEAEMDMGSMKHGCPVEVNPESNPADKLFKANFVFIMPGGMMGTWKLHMHFHNHSNDLEGEGELAINVVEANPVRMRTTVLAADSNAKIFVSFVLPEKGKVGLNDAKFTIHHKVGNYDFPATEDYTIEMEPTMPSMGHGSPNNVNPVHDAYGHYKGKLNFTMTGLWRIQLKLYKGGNLLTDQIFFDITL